MIDYLCRHRLVVPTSGARRGRGRERRYAFGDLVVLRAVSKLLSAGLSVTRLRESLAQLRKLHPEITLTSLPASHMVTDGRNVFLKHSDEVIEMLGSGQLAFLFVLELSVLQKEVIAELEAVNVA